MHLSHTRYSDGVQRRMSLNTVLPSLKFAQVPKSMGQSGFAYGRKPGGSLNHVESRCPGIVPPTEVFWRKWLRPTHCMLFGSVAKFLQLISSTTAARPNSASSSALSFRRQPVCLFTFCSVMFLANWRSSSMSGRATVYYLFWAGMEVVTPPFPQDIEYNQTVDKYQ